MGDLHKLFNHRWINSKAKSFNSPIEGLGTRATGDIKKGEVVGVLGGVIVPEAKIKELWKAIGHVGIKIDDDFYICPTSREELEETGVFNHSCEPNTGFKSSVVLVAIRDIKTGEELAFDYAFCETHFEAFNCNCKSASCRKIIKPTDWKIEEIRQKYREYFSPFLKSKIR